MPINQKNKRQFNFLPLVKYLYFIFRITPTIDIEPIKFDGMLIRTDKQFRHLKNSQKEKISNWLYDEYRNVYDKIGQAPDSRRNEEIVSAVYEKIEECGIWIPYYEVEKYYCSKKNKYRKRYENANLSATD